jgi:NifU-like protein involved in Fe-S cluster formation
MTNACGTRIASGSLATVLATWKTLAEALRIS